jgi:hypothetical protein
LLEIRYTASLLLISVGLMDCLTTVVGTVYLGTVELNPLIAGIVNSNIPVFVLMKIAITVVAALVFVFAERTLMRTADKNAKSFRLSINVLRIAFISIIVFLAIVVANNLFVILKIII